MNQIGDNQARISREYADLYEKYGYAWADAFNKAQGMGWNLVPVKPRSMLERDRVFLDFVKKGYAVHIEEKYGSNYIYVLKLPETGGRVSEAGKYRLEAAAGIKIREILMKYKAGLFDTMDAYQYIKDVVERK